jgi:hypothetical protein
MTDTIAKAERKASARAILFYLLAAAFAASAIMGIGPHHIDRIIVWMVLGILTALNLTPVQQWVRPGPLANLMNDESTRQHRGQALATGFWAAVVAALGLFAGADAIGLGAEDVARLVAAAALSTALVTFAALEQRASRG